MKLTVVDEPGVRFVEGVPGESFLTAARDVDRLIEACFSENARAGLLYAENMTPGFFDLSSGDLGAILQKLRNYGIRLAVVCPPGSTAFSSRFGELLADERRGTQFDVLGTRAAARDWIRKHSS